MSPASCCSAVLRSSRQRQAHLRLNVRDLILLADCRCCISWHRVAHDLRQMSTHCRSLPSPGPARSFAALDQTHIVLAPRAICAAKPPLTAGGSLMKRRSAAATCDAVKAASTLREG